MLTLELEKEKEMKIGREETERENKTVALMPTHCIVLIILFLSSYLTICYLFLPCLILHETGSDHG